jgi:hypothetical protein
MVTTIVICGAEQQLVFIFYFLFLYCKNISQPFVFNKYSSKLYQINFIFVNLTYNMFFKYNLHQINFQYFCSFQNSFQLSKLKTIPKTFSNQQKEKENKVESVYIYIKEI